MAQAIRGCPKGEAYLHMAYTMHKSMFNCAVKGRSLQIEPFTSLQ